MKPLIAFILLLAVILFVRLFWFYTTQESLHEGEEFDKTFTVFNEPTRNSWSQILFVDGIWVYLPSYPEVSYGDQVRISGHIEEKEYVGKNDQEVTKSLIVQKPTVEILDDRGLITPIVWIRTQIEVAFTRYLPKDESALLLGIVLGIRSEMSEKLKDDLKISGVYHIAAASGSNVTILGGFLVGALGLFVKRRLVIIFTISGILFYALISGFDPPIVRASLMASFTYVGLLLGKQTFGILSLFLASFIMLFISPLLLGDIGFQLSFLSTFGILTVKPLLDSVVPSRLNFIKQDLTTTLAAQIMTLPIMLNVLQSFSPVSIITNLLILWTIPILMALGLIASALALLLAPLSAPILYLCYPLLLYMNVVVTELGSISSRVVITNVPVIGIVGMYMVIGAVLVAIRKRVYGRKLV